ncbi:MAG TPA: hypothetical protein VFA68_02930 [Terriglobales bacterium]|nr:hypothetical protein [Terriglobales bacterium]
MPVPRVAVALLMGVTILAGSAAAQAKNELAGSLGRTFISDHTVPNTNFFDNTIHSGKGLTFEVTYARHLLGNGGFATLSFEVPAAFNPDEDLNYGINVIPKQYSSLFITPSARLKLFADTAVAPWFSFGGGFGHFSESSELLFGGTNPGKTGTTTGVIQFGGGLDVKIWSAFRLRGEVRDFDSGVPQLNVDTGKTRQHNLYVGAGIVFEF